MYLKPKYVNMILMAPFVMALCSVFFVVSGWMPFYYLTMLLVFFISAIYAVDLVFFVKVLVQGKFSQYISRLPVNNVKSVLGSLAVAVLYLFSLKSLLAMTVSLGDVLLLIVAVGVVFTTVIKAYKVFVFNKARNEYEDNYEDDEYDYDEEHEEDQERK